MVMEQTHGQMAENMQENGKIIKCMEKVRMIGKVIFLIKDGR